MKQSNDNLKYIITNSSATVFIDGEPKTIFNDDPKFGDACLALRGNQLNVVSKLFDISIENKSSGYMRRENDKIQVLSEDEWKDVPEELGAVITKFIDMDLPFDPLIHFAIKLLKSPSKSSIPQLFSFVKNNNLTLTENGNILLTKIVRSDYLDIYSGKFDNSVGKTVEVPLSEVEENPNIACAKGLHASSFTYIKNGSYGRYNGGDKVILVSVSPEDVISVPKDHSFQKVRCKKYTVIADMDHKFNDSEPLYSVERGFYGKVTKDSFASLDIEEQYELV